VKHCKLTSSKFEKQIASLSTMSKRMNGMLIDILYRKPIKLLLVVLYIRKPFSSKNV